MNGPLITVAMAGARSGYVLAVFAPAGEEHLPPSQRTTMGTVLAVGRVYRRSADGEPEDWRAWLWPVAGGNLAVTQHCDAVDAPSSRELNARLQKRADKEGPWW